MGPNTKCKFTFGNFPSQPKQAVQHLHLVRMMPLERWQGVEAHADRGDDDQGDREERDDLGGHRGVRLLKQVPQTSEDNIYFGNGIQERSGIA